MILWFIALSLGRQFLILVFLFGWFRFKCLLSTMTYVDESCLENVHLPPYHGENFQVLLSSAGNEYLVTEVSHLIAVRYAKT